MTKKYGIYYYYDKKNQQIVYIGKDSHINKRQRGKAHENPNRYYEQQINKVIQNNPDRYEYIEYCRVNSIDTLNQLEYDLINLYRPRFNFRHGGTSNIPIGGKNMSYNEIEKLINKYESTQYVKGEQQYKERKKKNRDYIKLQNRFRILDDLTHQLSFELTTEEYFEVKYFIERFNTSFKKLHANLSQTAIILAFIFLVKKMNNSHLNVENYTIAKQNRLTIHGFETILARITQDFMQKAPLRPIPTEKYDHEILLEQYPYGSSALFY